MFDRCVKWGGLLFLLYAFYCIGRQSKIPPRKDPPIGCSYVGKDKIDRYVFPGKSCRLYKAGDHVGQAILSYDNVICEY